MAQRIGATGVGLPAPQYLYPTELFNAADDLATNEQTLAPGQALVFPAGDFLVTIGKVLILQYKDPVNGIWRGFGSPRTPLSRVKSDGQNIRIANLTGCPVAAEITGAGSGYVQASTTVTANVGGSTWQPIVGGSVSITSITNAGSGYGQPPIVLIPDPPFPGVPATGYAILTSGTVSTVSLTNLGAGYLTAPPVALVPNPSDPNINSIVQATVTTALTAAGKLTAVLNTNPGAALATLSAITLTASGTGGSGATVAAVVMQTVTGVSVVAGGTGFTAGAEVSTYGGTPATASASGNPSIELTGYLPRAASIGMAAAAGTITSVSTIYDPGLFVGTPNPIVNTGSGTATTAASVTLIMGSAPDAYLIQPAP